MEENKFEIGKWTYDKAAALAVDVVNSSATFNLTWNGGIDKTTNAVERLSKIVGHPITIVDEFPELKGEYIPAGIAIEEVHADLNPPLPVEDKDDNAGKPREQSWRPAFFSYDIAKKYFKYTIKQDQFKNVSSNSHEIGLFMNLMLSTTANSISLYLNSLYRQLLGNAIGYVLEGQNNNNPVFDPTGKYSPVTSNKKLTYVKKDSNNTVFGIVMHEYDGTGENKVASWDEAVKKGIINELHLITSINRPGYGSDAISKKEVCENFVVEYTKIFEKLKTAKEGYTLSGVNCGNNIGEPILYLKDECIPYLSAYVYGNRDNEFRPNLRIKSIADFGNADSSVYGILIDTRGIKLHPTHFHADYDKYAEKEFINFVSFYRFRPFISAFSFIHIFKDPTVNDSNKSNKSNKSK